MIQMPLTPSQRRAYFETLSDPRHEMRTQLHLLDSNERYLLSMTGRLLSGQVVGDETATLPMSAQTSIEVDGLDRLPRKGDIIRARYEVKTPFGWYGPPVFTGPVDRAVPDESGDVLDVDLVDKRALLMGTVPRVISYRKGVARTSIIRDLAYDGGERRIDVPDWGPRTAGPLQLVPRRSVRWSHIEGHATAMRGQVFFNGAGALRLRRRPTRSSFTWGGRLVLTPPSLPEDDRDTINAVHVLGKVPASKKAVRPEAKAFVSGRLSPLSLGRNGVPRYLWEIVEDETIRTEKDAQKVADRRKRELEAATGQVTFTALPVPGVELGDLQTVIVGENPTQFRLTAFTLPLTSAEPMTVGYTKPLRRKRSR